MKRRVEEEGQVLVLFALMLVAVGRDGRIGH